MEECDYCKRPLNKKDAFCPFCGYDPLTKTISASFKPKVAPDVKREMKRLMKQRRERQGIRPQVKIFAFIGLALAVLLIFYKPNLNLKEVMSGLRRVWDKIRIAVSEPLEVEEKKKEEPETFKPSAPLLVQGLIWGGGKPQAIINNKIVNIGDVIEGAEVIEISKKGVVLLYKNNKYTLPPPASIYERH